MLFINEKGCATLKNKGLLSILLVLIMISSIGCSTSKTSVDAKKEGKLKQIVYIGEDHNIYRVNPDGSGKTKISDDTAYSFTLVDNYIYYQKESDNPSEDNKGYRMNLDGTGKTQIQESFYNSKLVDGWLYFDDMGDGKIYKMKGDGSSKTVLNDKISQIVDVANDWVYYIEFVDETSALLYRMKIDGSEKTKIVDDTFTSYPYIQIAGDFIYFINDTDLSTLYKMKVDGTERVKLSETITSANVVDNEIFCIGDGENLFKINADGSNQVKLTDDSVSDFETKGDWVYYVNYSESQALYKVKKDGSEKQKVSGDFIWMFKMNGDTIYYVNWNDGKLYSMDLNGSNKKEITSQCSITDDSSQFEFIYE